MTPTARSLAYLRKRGWTCAVVSRWNPWAKVRQDVWGGDILAMQDGQLLLINATDATSVSKHVDKMRAKPEVQQWIRLPSRQAVVMGWHKEKRGDAALVWRGIV